MDYDISIFDKLISGISYFRLQSIEVCYGFHSYYIMNKVYITEKGSDLRNELITE